MSISRRIAVVCVLLLSLSGSACRSQSPEIQNLMLQVAMKKSEELDKQIKQLTLELQAKQQQAQDEPENLALQHEIQQDMIELQLVMSKWKTALEQCSELRDKLSGSISAIVPNLTSPAPGSEISTLTPAPVDKPFDFGTTLQSIETIPDPSVRIAALHSLYGLRQAYGIGRSDRARLRMVVEATERAFATARWQGLQELDTSKMPSNFASLRRSANIVRDIGLETVEQLRFYLNRDEKRVSSEVAWIPLRKLVSDVLADYASMKNSTPKPTTKLPKGALPSDCLAMLGEAVAELAELDGKVPDAAMLAFGLMDGTIDSQVLELVFERIERRRTTMLTAKQTVVGNVMKAYFDCYQMEY